ncbi:MULTISPECIES: fluoride efflux transporter CrcB [Cysteiniphilum]|uniref:Fluoride-specific ion channel FluC n=1 Tax=Cysteiniphilum litorale TaxID=2056700 RepID=A0A8J2Z2D2_9GAMM|nr:MULTISPECIES: fluoride efflux transporter CrcB [Cysteiniphilum]MDA0910701.1 fluoride efflux transporter CrcB [Pseudomonadota bacterium]WHN64650.1 fluoride efflux transporter CrcB [Cysteiniphilum sp. QT6929]GGF89436.1 putative fluoride ion transporter CrcB [Cysteiniphilum litorale]
MLTLLLVGLGGGLGSISRFGLSEFIYKVFGKSFPHGILIVNILGCLLIGALAAFFQKERLLEHFLTPHFRALLITGFLGGFTTFSSFSLDALTLLQKGEWSKAIIYIMLSVLISMIAVFVGFYLVEKY